MSWLQADSTRHVGQMDFSDVYAGEDTPQSITLSLTTGQLTLTREQLRTLSWTSHTAVWKVRSTGISLLWRLVVRLLDVWLAPLTLLWECKRGKG